jgi:hypothetical protein
MLSVFVLCVAGAAPGGGQPPSTARPSTAEKVFALSAPSVVTVRARANDGWKQGSGVVLVGGLIVTNRHVIDGAFGDIKVSQGPTEWRAEVTHRGTADLALLQLLVHVGDKSPLKPARLRLKPVVVGEPVFAIGSPRQLEQSISDGIVSGVGLATGDEGLIRTTAAISPGSSGGGLFDAAGMLVGLTTMSLKDSQQLNFAIRAADIVALAEERPGSAAPEPQLRRLADIECLTLSVEVNRSLPIDLHPKLHRSITAALAKRGIRTVPELSRECPDSMWWSLDAIEIGARYLELLAHVTVRSTDIEALESRTIVEDDRRVGAAAAAPNIEQLAFQLLAETMSTFDLATQAGR